jgi:hypothetical protein
MHLLFDWPREVVGPLDKETGRYFVVKNTHWHDFCLYHSRFYCRRDNAQFSALCVADKLSVALEPWWLYLPRVILTGEIVEYMARAGDKEGTKYEGEPEFEKYRSMNLVLKDETAPLYLRRLFWHWKMCEYLRDWVAEHRDLRPDTWTPSLSQPAEKEVVKPL